MKRNDTKGYTLIELIIVLAILSAMLLMASLRADLGTAALRSEAQSVISAMRYTRQLNVNGELSQRFRIIAEDGILYYCVQSRTSPVKTYIKTRLDSSIIVQKKASADADFDSYPVLAQYTVVNKGINYNFFESYFSENAAKGDGTLILESADSKLMYKITVVPTSGRIYMYEIKR